MTPAGGRLLVDALVDVAHLLEAAFSLTTQVSPKVLTIQLGATGNMVACADIGVMRVSDVLAMGARR